MDDPAPATEDEDLFIDAFDEFSFDDSPSNVESQGGTVSYLECEHFDSEPSPDSHYTTPNVSGGGLDDCSRKAEPSESSEVDSLDITNPKPTENGTVSEELSWNLVEDKDEKSSASSVVDERIDDSMSVDARGEPERDGGSSSLLVYLAGLVIRAIRFQFNLLMGLFSLPLLSLYYTFAFITNPFGTLRRGVLYFVGTGMRIGGVVLKSVSPSVYQWLSDYKSILKLTLRVSWGLFWSAYVCIVLVGLLISSFVMSGLTTRHMVKEPLQVKEPLYFDYTKSSPVASVPITSCPTVSCVDCIEKVGVAKSGDLRVIPRYHKFQVTVSVTLPESDYNRNLGIFQVRVDCLSANGQVLASSRHPCMLPFKSQPVRLFLTSLKIVPLIAGYLSESQTLNLKIWDFTEGNVPTACLKVMVEPRAEFRAGAGIPEMYDASLLLESNLPLLKRILWQWRKTMFIWTTMVYFVMGLLFTLCCCTPILLPKPRASVDPTPVGREVH